MSQRPRTWAIADFHWSTSRPMERHGEHWRGHRERLLDAWRERVDPRDLVVVPGDITFARDPHPDLAELHKLSGQKVVVLGNHDHWAQGLTRRKLHELLEPYPTLHLLDFHRPYYETGNTIIVGWKGSEPPGLPRFKSSHHSKTMEHARNAAAVTELVVTSRSTVIVATHYPPSEAERVAMAPLNPALWLHGHAHLGGYDEAHVRESMETWSEPSLLCVSSDYVNQTPVDITDGVVQEW